MSELTSANRYEVSGPGISGVIDITGVTGEPVVSVDVDGRTFSEGSVRADEFGLRVIVIVDEVDDGNSVQLDLVLPEVNVSDRPVPVAGFAVLVTRRSSFGGPGLVEGALQLYDSRPVSAMASAVQS